MGVTLHRPWLDVSRAELRAYNADMKLEYVDDPSNENRDFTRVRARQALAIDQDLRADLLKQQTEALDRLNVERRNEANWLSRFANISPDGFVETSAVPTPELLLHMLNSVSGQGGPIDAAKRRRLAKAMTDSDFSGMTLSGAWIKKTLDGFLFTRDMVAVKTRRADKTSLEPLAFQVKSGEPCLWDGRFLIHAKTHNIQVEPALGKLGKLRDATETKYIFDLPAEVRGCLPLYSKAKNHLGFGGFEDANLKAEAVSAQRLHHLI